MFRRREFAAYLILPIPHPLDACVLAAINDREMWKKMTPDDAGILVIFAHRKAVEAVRNRSVAMLQEGFIALAVATELNGDYREEAMGLVVLFHCARLLQVPDQEAIDWVASSGFSQDAVETVRAFSQRPERERALSAFNMRETGSGQDFKIR
jgi:hypothetical protein